MSRFVRIACENCRCPSFNYISCPGHRAYRTYRAGRRHAARPPSMPATLISRSKRSALAGSSATGVSRKARRANASRAGVTNTSRRFRTTRPAGGTNTSPAPSPSLWTCSRPARSTSCPTSHTPRSAPKSCSILQTPKAPSATTSTPGPTVTTSQRVTPSAPRPYHRLQPRRYANLRRPAVARQRRHHLYL